MNLALIIPIIVYFILMIGVGIYSFKFTKSKEGFHLAGRNLGSWVSAISYAFSGMSAWVLIGYVGMVYSLGPSVFYILIGFNLGFLFAYMVIAKRVRNYSQLLGAVTYTDYFVKRMRGNPHFIRLVSGISIVIFMSAYTAAQLAAAGLTLQTVFGFEPVTAIIIAGIVVTAYCLFGGLMGVSLTDYFQGIGVVIGTVILGIFMIYVAGGWNAVVAQTAEISPMYTSANMGATGSALLGSVLGFLVMGLNVIGRPHDTIRFFALKSSAEVRKSAAICLSALTITYWGAFLVGYSGRVLFPEVADPEMIFPLALTELAHPLWGGILLAIFLGLLMSTADSQLLSASSALTEDIYSKYLNKNLSDKQNVLVTRIVIILIGVLSTIVAVTTPESVFFLTVYASAGLAATFAPVLILSLYWKKLTNAGAGAGMAAGALAVFIWYQSGLAEVVMEGVPGFIAAFLIAIIVSKLTSQPHEQQIEGELTKVSYVWK
ncbi:sodium/proline symporter [Texcoconibacillus texcoconensis]|uniref:Sodium/proline symporter n=1 Tax=Texcoconibacillus texcoconensis TaxID=1095777 RepID=A0A840QTE5_9BACI|nr:sodium/proline symporter [Texcoconibacillus texcoconensis]MBB5174578.1 sodium/proline symporter [Texcoconibacillus texcoconensis]